MEGLIPQRLGRQDSQLTQSAPCEWETVGLRPHFLTLLGGRLRTQSLPWAKGTGERFTNKSDLEISVATTVCVGGILCVNIIFCKSMMCAYALRCA